MKKDITQIVEGLRAYLRREGLAAYIFPSTDPHGSEYPPAHWKTREWVSGFDGSAGTAVVTLDDAALWTDSRYFIAAANQLQGTPFRLMKERVEGTPSIAEWLADVLPAGSRVGIDGWTSSTAEVDLMATGLMRHGIALEVTENPADTLWTNRPALPDDPVCIQPLRYAGRGVAEKLSLLRADLSAREADGLILTALDEIAWTLNLRGTDVHCNPVFVSYMLVTPDRCTLYINKVKLTDEVSAHLAKAGVRIRDYGDIIPDLRQSGIRRMLLDPAGVNFTLRRNLPEGCAVIDAPSPAAMRKAVKCPAEVEGFRRAMLRDGVAMVKFLRWLKPAVEAGGQTELSVCRKLAALRAEQDLYCGESFDTIAGYAAHGAIVHYEPTPDTDIPLRPKGLLLLDSGAQYEDGTTDLTRTIALGPVTEEERRDYTLVLKGHIRLALAKFPQGCSGTQLDICARYAMWQEGINFLHGTGHGVGHFLNVHEGPQNIRLEENPTPLMPGMITSNEPGLYRTGEYGIRCENLILTVPDYQNEFGMFYRFETLTLFPFDIEALDLSIMTEKEIDWLNNYHEMVYDRLSPMLDEEEQQWLHRKTMAI